MKQAFGLGVMIVWETFNPWPQNRESLLVPKEVLHEIRTSIPDPVRVGVDRREDIEQVFNIYVLRRDPLRCFEAGLVRINSD